MDLYFILVGCLIYRYTLYKNHNKKLFSSILVYNHLQSTLLNWFYFRMFLQHKNSKVTLAYQHWIVTYNEALSIDNPIKYNICVNKRKRLWCIIVQNPELCVLHVMISSASVWVMCFRITFLQAVLPRSRFPYTHSVSLMKLL